MKIVIAGSHSFTNYEFLEENCNSIIFDELGLEPEDVTIISGTAKGADTLGEHYAKEYGMKLHKFPAFWRLHGKSAGMLRNTVMANEADYIILFDMGTPGTTHMLQQAIKKNVPHRHFLIHE